jgi:hypothetical protein
MTPEQVKFLRQHRKTMPLLVALHILEGPTGETEIARILEISCRSARDLLDSLERLGLAVRTGRYSSFVLSQEALDLKFLDRSGKLFRSSIINNDSDSCLNSSPESIKTIKTLTREDHTARGGSGKKVRFGGYRDKTGENDVDSSGEARRTVDWEGIPADLVQAFREARLLPNHRTRELAKQEHITPTYVRAHYQELVERGLGDQTGILICTLEANMPMPEVNESGHLKGCECEDCQCSGEYRGWVSS